MAKNSNYVQKRSRKWKRVAKKDRRNLKLWAEGARETILKPHIPAYTDALERGWRAERDYLREVCQEFHARISWRLADDEEPDLPLPAYDRFAIPVVEELSEEVRREIGQVRSVWELFHPRSCGDRLVVPTLALRL